ncbi:MAG: hypothetical protein ACI9J2_002129 [Saprospiraceae bacterium]|jgi:hypothetical protein
MKNRQRSREKAYLQQLPTRRSFKSAYPIRRFNDMAAVVLIYTARVDYCDSGLFLVEITLKIDNIFAQQQK